MSMVKGVKGRQVYLRDEELLRRREENKNYLLELGSEHPVSYTHLTLPTNREV